MSWIAALLIVTSAFMHASWNYISKRRSPTLAFYFIASASAALVVSPLLVANWGVLPFIPVSVWLLLILTGGAQTLYYYGLASAYQHGDMSLAYPLARALPVLAVAGINMLVGKGEEISHISLVGMLLISVGCIILPLPHFRHLNLRVYTDVVYLMAFVAACGTTAYTLIDDNALHRLRTLTDLSLSTTQITLLFITLETISTTVILGLTVLASKSERQRLMMLVLNRQLRLTGMLTGVVIMVTYGLVLASMAYVRNVSYVAAFRQLSIPTGAVLGLKLQQEASYPPKLAGIAILSIGLILVGFG